MQLINIGFGNMVSSARLLAIVSPDSAPIKRVIQEAKDRGMLIDASFGRRTRAVVIMDTDHVIVSAIQPEGLAGRAGLGAEWEKRERRCHEAGKAFHFFRPLRGGEEYGHSSDFAAASGLSLFRLCHHAFAPEPGAPWCGL